jgi:flagellar biosynthesis protein FlhF
MSTQSAAPHTAAPHVYQGRSIEELIPKIQADLGDDAIVVRRRKGLTGGIGGFFQRPFVEIEARPGAERGQLIDMYDEDEAAMPAPLPEEPAAMPASAPATAPTATPTLMPTPTAVSPAPAAPPASPAPVAGGPTPEWPPVASPPRPPLDPSGFSSAYVTAALAALAAVSSHEAKFDAAQRAMTRQFDGQSDEDADQFSQGESHSSQDDGQFSQDADQFSAALAAAEAAVAEQVTVTATGDHEQPPIGMRRLEPTTIGAGQARASVQRSLLDVGVGQDFIDELIGTAVAHTLALNPRLSLARAVHRTLRQRIPVCPPLPATGATIAVVGPGGGGKTACCAGLLGAYRRGGILPAACATIVGGAGGELAMLLSPHVLEPTAVTAPHASRVLCRAREEGMLLLDMPPLSPADGPAIDTLAALLDELEPDRVVVALPATLGARPAAQLLEALRPLQPSALAITHADATDQLGVAVQAACMFGLAPEYLLDRTGSHGGLTAIDPTYLADRLLS